MTFASRVAWFAATALLLASTGAGGQTLELVDTVATGAQPRLALDPGRHRLYVVESTSRSLRVYDTRTRDLLQQVALTSVPGSTGEPGAMAIEVDRTANLVYVSFWGSEHRIWIFDGETLEATILPRFDASYDSLYPLYIAVDEARTRAYVCHETPNGTVTVIDGLTKAQTTQIKHFDNVCRGATADPRTGRVYLTTASHQLYRIDPVALTATNLGPWGRGPLQVDDASRRILVSSDHYVHLAVLDADTEEHTGYVGVPGTTDIAVVPGGTRLYAANNWGRFLAVVEPGVGELARFSLNDPVFPFCCNGEVLFDPETRLIFAGEYFAGDVHVLRDNGLQQRPVATGASVSTNEDTALELTLAGTDADGDTLTFRITSGPSHGSVTLSGAHVVYTPAGDYFGPDQFSFVASDATADSEPAVVHVDVHAVNDAPTVVGGGPYAATLGESVVLAATASDIEDATLTWQWDLDGDGAYETSASSPTHLARTAGTQTVAVRVVDSGGLSATASVVVEVGYGVCLLYRPDHAVRSGATIPLRLQLCDAEGKNASSPNVTVTAVGVVRLSDDASGPVEDAGQANPDANFRYDASLAGYIFNYKTAGLQVGTWSVEFVTSTGGKRYSAPFQVR